MLALTHLYPFLGCFAFESTPGGAHHHREAAKLDILHLLGFVNYVTFALVIPFKLLAFQLEQDLPFVV